MCNVRFISDHHFGHELVLKYRKFKSMYDMHNHMIEMHNEVVHKKDLTYFLGDVVWDLALLPLLNKMNGRKVLVLGNHDDGRHIREYLKYFEYCTAMFKYKGIFITHCPIHPQELEYRVPINIHGHLHEYLVRKNITKGRRDAEGKQDMRYINVSCEQLDYKPRTLNYLLNKNGIEGGKGKYIFRK